MNIRTAVESANTNAVRFVILRFWSEIGAVAVARGLKRRQLNCRMRKAGMRVLKGGRA